MMNNIFQRVSVREFLDKEVEEEKVRLLLKAAMAAPSAGNQQPWEIYVVDRPEILQRLSECSPYAGCVKSAPLALVLCYDMCGLRFGECVDLDMSAATENLLLEAEELGLGAVWLGIAPLKERMDAVKRLLLLPDCYEAFSVVPIGYPAKRRGPEDRYRADRVHYVRQYMDENGSTVRL